MAEPIYTKIDEEKALKTTEIEEEIYKAELEKRKIELQEEIKIIDDVLKIWK